MSKNDLFSDWCGAHPKCKGCRFRGNECVAPEAPHKFNDWIEDMKKLIKHEIQSDNHRLEHEI